MGKTGEGIYSCMYSVARHTSCTVIVPYYVIKMCINFINTVIWIVLNRLFLPWLGAGVPTATALGRTTLKDCWPVFSCWKHMSCYRAGCWPGKDDRHREVVLLFSIQPLLDTDALDRWIVLLLVICLRMLLNIYTGGFAIFYLEWGPLLLLCQL